MAFTVGDFSDLKQLLAEHPQWRVELRHLLLSEDFEALPGIVRELAEAQRRTEERLEELAEAQRRTEARLEELAEAQRRTEERLTRLEEVVAQLAEAQRRTEGRLDRLQVHVEKMDDRLADLQGQSLETNYERKAPAYFGRWLRRTEVVGRHEMLGLVEDRLTPDEVRDVLLTDLFVRGRVAQRPDKPEVWLAVEVFSVVDQQDVERAVHRAELLRRAGLPALPVVAGKSATEGAQGDARARGVAMLSDGADQLWDEALAAWGVAS